MLQCDFVQNRPEGTTHCRELIILGCVSAPRLLAEGSILKTFNRATAGERSCTSSAYLDVCGDTHRNTLYEKVITSRTDNNVLKLRSTEIVQCVTHRLCVTRRLLAKSAQKRAPGKIHVPPFFATVKEHCQSILQSHPLMPPAPRRFSPVGLGPGRA
jgi:hypothetical protein